MENIILSLTGSAYKNNTWCVIQEKELLRMFFAKWTELPVITFDKWKEENICYILKKELDLACALVESYSDRPLFVHLLHKYI